MPILMCMSDLLPPPPRPDVAPPAAWNAAGGSWAAGAEDEGPPRRRGPRVVVAAATVVVVLAAALWVVLLRPSGTHGPGVALAMSFPKDRDVLYRVSASMDGTVGAMGRSIELSVSASARLGLHAVSVDGQGVTTVRLSATRVRATANGRVVRSPNRQSVVRITSDGRILGGESLLPSSGATIDVPGSGEFTPLPDHPVRVGEEWTNDMAIPLPLGNANVHYTSSSRLVRYVKVYGVRAAVIETEGDAALDHITARASDLLASTGNRQQLPAGVDPLVQVNGSLRVFQTAWLDLRHNLLVKSSGSGTLDLTMNLEDVPAGQDPGDITMNARISMAMDRL